MGTLSRNDQARNSRVAALLVISIASVTTALAQNVTWKEDVSGGSCKEFKQHVASVGVHNGAGTSMPTYWGVTEPIILINGKRIDDPSVTSGIGVDVKDAPTGGLGGTAVAFCKSASNFRFKYSADASVSVVEWQHDFKSKACKDEWLRARGYIRSHEQKHIADIARIVANANAAVAGLSANACGPDNDAAMKLLGQRILKALQGEVAKIRAQATQAAQQLDAVERDPKLNCKPCEGKIAFQGVKLTARAPYVETTQIIAGDVCGDPYSSSWTMHVRNRVVSPAGVQEHDDKPWDNDCLEPASPEIARRNSIFTNGPGGGWFCIYTPGTDTKPGTVTIRMPKLTIGPMKFDAPNDKTVTATESECEDKSQEPAPARPVS